MARELYINTGASSPVRGLTTSASDSTPISALSFTAGDTIPLEMSFYSNVSSSGSAKLTMTGYTVKAAIKDPNAKPTSGTFTLSDQGATTSPMDFDATTTTVQAYLNALNTSAGVDSKGTCTVTGATGSPFFIKFDNAYYHYALTGDASKLTPATTMTIVRSVEGDGSTLAQQYIKLDADPLASKTSGWTIAGNVVTGSLDLNTEGIYRALGTATSVSTTFEIEITDGSSNVSTVVQLPVTILAECNAS